MIGPIAYLNYLPAQSAEALSQSPLSQANSEENPGVSNADKANTPIQPAASPDIHSPGLELAHDLQHLPAMKLRQKYSREASSHRNMKIRAPNKGGKIHLQFQSLAGFLKHVGPMPGPGKYTLDRIDNNNPDYGPGLVRWATATEQNNNKGDTIFLTAFGRTCSLSEWARLTGQSASVLRQRYYKAMPPEQVIFPRGGRLEWAYLLPGSLLSQTERFEAAYQSGCIWRCGVMEKRIEWLLRYAASRVNDMAEILREYTDPDGNLPDRFAKMNNEHTRWLHLLDHAKKMRVLTRIREPSLSEEPSVTP